MIPLRVAATCSASIWSTRAAPEFGKGLRKKLSTQELEAILLSLNVDFADIVTRRRYSISATRGFDTLIDYLKGGHSIDEFLEGFPTVERWQVEAFLELSPEAVDHLRQQGASAA